MTRPTTKDLAKAAGVSLATIDRVLNSRPGVRKTTVEKVNKAIKDIKFVRDLSAANLARRKKYEMVFILPDHEDEFICLIRNTIKEVNQSLAHERINVTTIQTLTSDPHRLAEEIDKLSASSVDGVAIMAPETPQVRDAISRLNARGIAIVAFVSNQSNAENSSFVGINNEAAGRTVGQLMVRFTGEKRGKILVLSEIMQSRDSQERRLGFDKIISKYTDRLVVGSSLEDHGDSVRTSQIFKTALQNDSTIVGIYLMSHDIHNAMQSIEKFGSLQDIVIIAHELTPQTCSRLVDGSLDAVITQDVGHLVHSAIRTLKAKITKVNSLPLQDKIRIEITLRENMPEKRVTCN